MWGRIVPHILLISCHAFAYLLNSGPISVFIYLLHSLLFQKNILKISIFISHKVKRKVKNITPVKKNYQTNLEHFFVLILHFFFNKKNAGRSSFLFPYTKHYQSHAYWFSLWKCIVMPSLPFCLQSLQFFCDEQEYTHISQI